MNPSPRITLRLLGSPSLAGGDGAFLGGPAAQRHRLAMLALLAMAPTRSMARETLTAYLWPERDAEHARLLLNQSVHTLRKALGKEAIVSAGDALRLDTDVLRVDATAFREALAAGELARAEALYSGPFLEGFSLQDAPEFERWVDAAREGLRQDHCRALEGLAAEAAAEGEVVRAAEWWRRRVAADPYDARVTLRLMEALEAAGDRAGAIRQARLHAALLEQELAAEPDPRVSALAERLRREPSPVAGGAAPTTPPPPPEARPSSFDTAPRDRARLPDGSETPGEPRTTAARARAAPVRWRRAVFAGGVILAATAGIADLWRVRGTGRLAEVDPTRAERTPPARGPTTSPAADNLYLKGRFFWNQRTRSGYARAIEYFERAIEADPWFAQAYAGLAAAYAMQGLSGDLAPETADRQTRAAVLRALELAPELAEAHTVLGGYYEAYAWDPDAAERELLRALELDPRSPTAHHWYGNVLTTQGRFEEAIAAKRRAVELDPLAPVLIESLAHTLSRAGRVPEALAALEAAIELDSTYWRAHARLGALYEATGQVDPSIRAYARAAELAGSNPGPRASLARVLAAAGRREEAQRLLDSLRSEAVGTGIYAPAVALVLLALDDVEGALAWLEGSYEQRHPQLRNIGGPGFARLADEPRYVDLRRRIGLR